MGRCHGAVGGHERHNEIYEIQACTAEYKRGRAYKKHSEKLEECTKCPKANRRSARARNLGGEMDLEAARCGKGNLEGNREASHGAWVTKPSNRAPSHYT